MAFVVLVCIAEVLSCMVNLYIMYLRVKLFNIILCRVACWCVCFPRVGIVVVGGVVGCGVWCFFFIYLYLFKRENVLRLLLDCKVGRGERYTQKKKQKHVCIVYEFSSKQQTYIKNNLFFAVEGLYEGLCCTRARFVVHDLRATRALNVCCLSFDFVCVCVVCLVADRAGIACGIRVLV